MLLGQVELKLLFKARACIALTQGLERSPVCAELLRDALYGDVPERAFWTLGRVVVDDDVVYWYSFSNHYTKRAFTQP